MRLAALLFFLAAACLTASSVAWLAAGAAAGPPAATVDPGASLALFEESSAAPPAIDVAALYAGRLELLDPKLALPTWHLHAREDAVRVHKAIAKCPPPAAFEPSDAALAKALAWHAATCASGAPPGDDVDRAPFMHPSGRSYAALALARGAQPSAIASKHARALHVVELGGVDASLLSPELRALASIPPRAWEALGRGDELVLTPASLVVATHGPLGLATLRVHPRASFEAFLARRSLGLTPRHGAALCARPASPDLCWEALPFAARHRALLVSATVGSAGLAVLASLGLALLYLRERRRAHQDRVHVLRTLTHELRTPATSLRLDVEPLRAAYDELPAACQEPLLRLSDGVERLHRVIHRSARYLALFETPGAPAEGLLRIRDLASARELFEELAGEWPEGVTLVAPPGDAPLRADPEWLGVALKNLVENAARHGSPPVVVSWTFAGDALVVRVADAGASPGLSLRRAVMPFARREKSEGLGLGLALVDRVARLLGGRLRHEPSPTVFELRLPCLGGRA